MLTMTVFTTVSLTAFFLENQNRVVTGLFYDRTGNFRAGNNGRTDFFTDSKHFVKCYSGTDFCVELFNDNDIVFRDFVLLAACLDDCEHFSPSEIQ